MFGYLCYASVLPKEDKFVAIAKRTVFMGYSETQKEYRLYDLESNIFLVIRDVSFREPVFPFKERNCGNYEDGDSFMLDPNST